jgi:DNA-binding MarR family transcriptional regulator
MTSLPKADRVAKLATDLRIVLRHLKRRLSEQSSRSDLTPSQVSVILRLEQDGPAAVSSLARAEGMRPQSMSSVVKVLQDEGLVRGSANPNDRRQTLMALTRKCETRLKDGRAARQDWLASTIQRELSAQEQERLSEALALLSRLIGG